MSRFSPFNCDQAFKQDILKGSDKNTRVISKDIFENHPALDINLYILFTRIVVCHPLHMLPLKKWRCELYFSHFPILKMPLPFHEVWIALQKFNNFEKFYQETQRNNKHEKKGNPKQTNTKIVIRKCIQDNKHKEEVIDIENQKINAKQARKEHWSPRP
jgi:hypothetical protein